MARISVSIDELKPTQLTLGLDEVNKRADKIAALSAEELERLLLRKAVPYVIGPRNEIYIVDHHHLSRALWSIGKKEVLMGKQLADWSDMDTRAFWQKMASSGYCWAIDAEGQRRPYSAIPRHISELTDNVWRTLARAVRGKAFSNEDTPFQEFIWGEYFRTFMSHRLLQQDFELACKVAMRVAHLAEAEDLPGYRA